jgi:hemoglobin
MNAFPHLPRQTVRVTPPLQTLALPTLVLGLFLSACGSNSTAKKDEFFTSGNAEADQRASQRMAKAEQLAGAEADDDNEANQGLRSTSKQTLYDRLGGQSGIAAIVEDFVPRALQDPRVNWARAGKGGGIFVFGDDRKDTTLWNPSPENIATLKKHLEQFLALATGGPANYDGQNMKAAHEGMEITNTEFDASVGDLKASLDQLKVPDREQKELLAIIETTRPQIVTER